MLLFFSGNFYDSVLGPGVVLDRGLQSLVSGCDHLMKLKLKEADVLLCFEVRGLTCVIHIICLDHEVLSVLEVIVNIEVGHKVRVQVVVDALCLP